MRNLIEEVKEIDKNNDMFGTYKKAKSICEFLELDSNKEILEKNNLIAIYEAWGTGKSCLMKTIYSKLDCNKFIEFMLNDSNYFKYLTNDDNEIDDEKRMSLINIVNDII